MDRSNEPTWCKCWANRTRRRLLSGVLIALYSLQTLSPATAALAAQSPATFPECQQTATQLEAGKRRVAQKDYTGAIREFRSALSACPQDQVAMVELTRAYLAARQFNNAEHEATQLLATESHSEDGQYLLAYSYFMEERFPEAGKVLQKLLAQNGKNPDAHKLMGLTLFFYKEYVMAESELETSLRDRPHDQETLYYLGRIYYTQNSFHPAVDFFRRLIKENPRSYKGFDNLGLCYEALGRTDDAVTAFKRAQELARAEDPNYDWPYANLAEMLLKTNRADEALPYAEQAAQINPRSARNQFLVGKALSHGNDLPSSIEHLTKSVQLDPNYPEPHYLLGQLYRKLGRLDEANHEFELFKQISEKTQSKKN
jgi:tetratricopeptide (TPR) repeat protein